MKSKDGNIPKPEEIEKELAEFLAQKFGGNVKLVSGTMFPMQEPDEEEPEPKEKKEKKGFKFDFKPEDLISYLDRYIIKQEEAKAILSTKICTHFNRVKRLESDPDLAGHITGGVKNNVLMIGPTGVGKTYMIKLIANKIGVPFVKGDATKFSETGYVGGDVEDLIRDLLKEADDDIDLAECGIVYIDEVDKIAGNRNIIGSDISRAGVQRALLKPMEETEVDIKIPHDHISMIQELERMRKSNKPLKRSINTKNILFIMSGAFSDLGDIIKRRITNQPIGFGSDIKSQKEQVDILKHVKSEDIIEFGFESEFVGRLPVRAILEKLTQEDLFSILKNANNPIILGKKLDFAAYGIDIIFDDEALSLLAEDAFKENTGARGLVSAVERALLPFEKKLPSTEIKRFAVTPEIVKNPGGSLQQILDPDNKPEFDAVFEKLKKREKESIRSYLENSSKNFAKKYNITMTESRINLITEYYLSHIMDIEKIVEKIKSFYDEIKKMEFSFYEDTDINIILEEDTVDFIIRKVIAEKLDIKTIYSTFVTKFELGLKLVKEKTGVNRFFIAKNDFLNPEEFVKERLKKELQAEKPDAEN